VADIFRIETAQTQLSWNGTLPDSSRPYGRLAISLSDAAATNITISRHGVPSEAARDVNVEVGPRLYEETAYNFFLCSTNKKRVELRHRDPRIVQGLHTLSDGSILHGTINFKSEIGRSSFSVFVDGKAEYDFEVEVFPSKLDYAADYDALLADVQAILTSLVLEYLRSTFSLGFITDSANSSQLEWILLLRHVVDGLERGLRYIEQHPHHGLSRERVATRIEKLRRADPTIFKMVAQGKGQGPKSKTISGLVLHTKLPERRARVTWDTAEHRWLASQLVGIRRRLAEIHSAERSSSGRQDVRSRHLRTLEEIDSLENRIARLQMLEPIAETKGFAPAGFTSLTLQSKPGYREAYRACLVLRLGLRVDDGPVRLSVKELHQLYEYWCYLAVVRMVARITEKQISVRDLFSIGQNGLRVRLKQGKKQTVSFAGGSRSLELTYNPQYKGDGFIFPQKPDVVLTFRDPHWPTMQLVFDAKYRLVTEPDYVRRLGCPGPPQTAIDALHRYRDAILETTGLHGSRSETFKRTVVEGVALFPYADVDDQYRTSAFWLALEQFGIGAIPFLPRETRYVEEWLRVVLRRGGWSTAASTIPYPSLAQLRAWQEAEKEAVLIGVLRSSAQEHLDWIQSTRCYYTPLSGGRRGKGSGRQLVSRWVGIYSPASMRQRGAITHLAAVENIEFKKRRQINTPWLPQRDPDEMQVVYTLGEVVALERPIENKGDSKRAQSFTHNRWTSRLAIMRATELRELFLETSMEWRLYEQLQIASVEFTLKPGPATLQDESDPRGRTWFLTKDSRVQYRGSAGFVIQRTGLLDEYESDLEQLVQRLIKEA
jgi:uncharacterized protein